MENTVRETKRADELAVGDWLALEGSGGGVRPAEVMALVPFQPRGEVKQIQIVYRKFDGRLGRWAPVYDGRVPLATEAEVSAQRERGDRAKKIADIRAYVDWLEANPDEPVGYGLGGQVDVPGVARVREFAARHGAKVRDDLDDRTTARLRFGSVEHVVIAWHRDGRPADPKPGTTCEELSGEDLGEDFDRSQTADADTTPPPVVGRRREPHTGGVTDEGLVDETASRLSMGWNGPCVASLHIPTPGENCLVCDAEGMRYGEHVEVSATAAETCSAQCACGTEVSGFDSLAEAEAELAIRIRDASATCLGRDMDCGRKLPCPDHPAAELASES